MDIDRRAPAAPGVRRHVCRRCVARWTGTSTCHPARVMPAHGVDPRTTAQLSSQELMLMAATTRSRTSVPDKSHVHHPIFARMYRRMAAEFEHKGVGEHRDQLLQGLSGRVVEVGAGTGLNFAHYPADVTEVVAVEPEPYLRDAAERAANDAAVSVTVLDGTADELPGRDGEFDAGVASLVLCSVPNPTSALGELFRVIRPGGELRFYEHVRSSSPGFARAQRVLDLVWPCFGGG